MQPQAQEPEQLEQSLNALLEDVRARTDQIAQTRWRLDRKEITGHSRDGEVTVRLLGSGRFVGVDIDPGALRRYEPEAVGSLVLDAVNDGLRKLEEAGRTAFAPFLDGGEPR